MSIDILFEVFLRGYHGLFRDSLICSSMAEHPVQLQRAPLIEEIRPLQPTTYRHL